MVTEKDHIDMEVTADDNASKTLKKTAATLDDLGRAADDSSDSMEGLEKQQDKTAKSTDKLAKQLVKGEKALADSRAELKGLREELKEATGDTGALEAEIVRVEKSIKRQNTRLERLARTYKGYTSAVGEAAESTKDFNEQQEQVPKTTRKSEGSLKRLWKNMRGGSGILRKTTKMFFKFFKFVGKWGIKGIGIGTGIAFLGTAVKGLGAAAIAGVAGLAPLTGMLIAYPGIIGAVMQSFGAMKLATGGVGEMIGVFSDPKATAEQIEEATKGMAQNQIKFARAVADSAKGWKEVKKHVGSEFFEGMDDAYRKVSAIYMPIMDKYLTRQSKIMNNLALRGAEYLQTFEGQKTVATIMQNNNKQSRNYGKALGSMTRLMGILLMAGGPMLVKMSKDVAEFTDRLADNADGKRGKLRQFFNHSYRLLKSVIHVTDDYATGLYNIAKNSEVLGDFMGDSIKDTGKQFKRWSKSEEGIADTKAFFEDMIPVVKELGYWLRDLASLGTGVPMKTDDFVESSKALREKIVPMIGDAFDFLSDHTVPAIERLIGVYENLKEGGVVGGATRFLDKFFGAIEKAASWLAKMPDGAQKAVAFATGLFAAYKIMKRMGVISAVGAGTRAVTGGAKGQGLGVQNVYVTNWPKALRGGGTGSGGGKGGKGSDLALGAGAGAALDDDDDDDKKRKKGSRRKGAMKGGLLLGSAIALTNPDELMGMAGQMKDNAVAWEKLFSQDKFGTADRMRRRADTQNPDPLYGQLGANPTITDHMVAQQEAFADAAKRSAIPAVAEEYQRQADNLAHILSVGEKTQPFMDSLVEDTFVPGISVVHDFSEATNGLNGQMGRLGGQKPKPHVELIGAEKAKSDAEGVTTAINNIPKNPQVLVNIKASLKASGGLFKNVDMLYTGGATTLGGKYLVGELGPEAWMNKAGVVKMLGLGGPELVSPGTGAVLPAGFTKDPSKSAGQAPDWAAKAYRKRAAGTESDSQVAQVRKSPRSASDASDRPIHVDQSGWQIGSGTDAREVARLAKKAVKDAIREAEERR